MIPPTMKQMREALGTGDEAFAHGWTIRRCRECGEPTPGGPTLCERCGRKGRPSTVSMEFVVSVEFDDADVKRFADAIVRSLRDAERGAGR